MSFSDLEDYLNTVQAVKMNKNWSYNCFLYTALPCIFACFSEFLHPLSNFLVKCEQMRDGSRLLHSKSKPFHMKYIRGQIPNV